MIFDIDETNLIFKLINTWHTMIGPHRLNGSISETNLRTITLTQPNQNLNRLKSPQI